MSIFKRGNDSKKDGQAGAAKEGIEPRHVTGSEFDAVVLESTIPAVVDFWAEWCGPCHVIAPSVEQLATEYEGRALVAKVNADDFPEILSRYGIMGIPTLIYFRDGKEMDRVIGMTSYGTLKSKLEKLVQAS